MKNNLRRLDIEIACDNIDLNSIERLNIANNRLEYIHPSIFTRIPNLADLDLSENNLHVMYIENIHLFGKLFKGAKNVKTLSLAFNRFIGIPEDFFDSIQMLEIINLAGNRLTQNHFKLHHLRNLRVLNLANNNIKVLDGASMKWLDTLAAAAKAVEDNNNIGPGSTSNGRVEVDINGNPVMCDTCEKKIFTSWLSKAKLIDTLSGNVTCRSETGDQIQVNKEAVTLEQDVCDRNTRKLILIIMTSVLSAIFASVALIVHMRRRHVRKQRKRNDVMKQLRLGELRFAVFLSYSSDDGDFVRENVVEPLNEGLQRIIDTDRNLVCQGDSELRLGQYVHNESLRCIELSTVFLSVISNSYCSSTYCDSEFNQALQLGKPVLLMIKDNVDTELMAPAMQLLLWAYENEQYILKTSWQNVCESILDMTSN